MTQANAIPAGGTAGTAFERATAVEPLGGGAYRALMDEGFWVVAGPNGGYVAAVLLRALEHALGDPGRSPRSLTVHYLARPAAGETRVETRVERTGRSLSTLSARMTQDGRLLCLALAAFSAPWPRERDFSGLRPPAVPPPDRLDPVPPGVPSPPIAGRFELRPAIGPVPFSGAEEAATGGWLRLAERDAPPGAALVACACDAWIPAVFTRLDAPAAVPTVDLTIHFRAALPLAGASPDDWLLASFRSRHARDGFVEEDGEVFGPDGTLLAQSRQLALLA